MALHASTCVASACLHPSGATCRLFPNVAAAKSLGFCLVIQQTLLFSRPLPGSRAAFAYAINATQVYQPTAGRQGVMSFLSGFNKARSQALTDDDNLC